LIAALRIRNRLDAKQQTAVPQQIYFVAFFFRLLAGRLALWPFQRFSAPALPIALICSCDRAFARAFPPALPISVTSMTRTSLIFFPIAQKLPVEKYTHNG